MSDFTATPLVSLLDKLESGKRPKGGVRNIADGVPSVGGEHLSNSGGFKFKHIKYVPKEFALEMKKGQVQKGDILVVKDGATTAKVSYVDSDFPYTSAVINEHVFLCRTKPEVSSKYVFYYLWSELGRRSILKDFRGAAQGGISMNFAKVVVVPTPNKKEQDRIVSKIDELLSEINDSTNELVKGSSSLSQLKSSALKRAFYQNTTQTAPLIDLIAEPLKNGHSAKATKNSNGIPTLTLTAITTGDFSDKNIKITTADKDRVTGLWLEKGDILIERSNTPELVGISRTYTGASNNVIFPDLLIRIRADKTKTTVKYLQYFLDYLFMSGYFQKIARGTSGTMPKINQTMLENILVPCGSLDEQAEVINEIETITTQLDSIEKTLHNAMKEASKLKQTIFASAFSGALDTGDEL